MKSGIYNSREAMELLGCTRRCLQLAAMRLEIATINEVTGRGHMAEYYIPQEYIDRHFKRKKKEAGK